MKTTITPMKMSGWAVGLALALMVSSPSVFGQVTVDGIEKAESGKTYTHGAKNPVINEAHVVSGPQTKLENNGQINTANIYEGVYISNAGSATNTVNASGPTSTQVVNYNGKIGTLNQKDEARTVNYGNITEANIYGGSIQNNDSIYSGKGSITTANLYGGHFINQSQIITANVEGGTFATSGNVTTVNITGGTAQNTAGSSGKPGGYINTVNISGGWLDNQYRFAESYGINTIGTVNVSDNGKVTNGKDAVINTVNLDGGMVGNFGKIDDLIYTEGTYSAKQYVNGAGQTVNATKGPGSIGTLTAAGTLQAHDDWGIVENLQFQYNGSGQVNVAANASAESIGFSGVKANNVDFTFGNIWLDLGGVSNFGYDWILSFVDMNLEKDISFATLFDANEVTNAWDINSFYVSWDTDTSFGILDNGVFASGWGFNENYTWFVYSDSSSTSSATPEPATLAMLGLGLVSLPLARFLRKKQ